MDGLDVLQEIVLFSNPIIDDRLARDVLDRKHAIEFSVHGLDHWQRVERNGLFLASQETGDSQVISLFALFHDSQRINDYEDPEHGVRGGVLASEFHAAGRLQITDQQLQLLIFACTHHTDIVLHNDPTVQCCWDGDRLDLTRIGVLPEPSMLNTATAKRIAESMDYSEIENSKPTTGEQDASGNRR